MIYIFVGTKAQFIKMVPIMIELKKRGISFKYIDSGQHAYLTSALRKIFKVGEPDSMLSSNADDITRISRAFFWFGKNLVRSIFDRKWLKTDVFPQNGICLIHGDTLSSLLGAFMAILAGIKVCHIEAGLRSFNWLDPFPEEIIRLICMRFSDVLFAPSIDAFENLKNLKVKGKIFLSNGNTVIDSIRYIKTEIASKNAIKEKYAVATCHRMETISDPNKLASVINLLNMTARKISVVFVAHDPTLKYLYKFKLSEKISRKILIKNLMDYPEFLSLITLSEFVLTDGGSIQEECAFLNKKCLIIRNRSERKDGIGRNAMVWEFDADKARRFLNWKIPGDKCDYSSIFPSERIVDYLLSSNCL
ncbi:MAG: UDP-N-acetylglucosamine 2-epimerase [Candidatus Vecturithrix sp.]|nr:UDP-N-acetylglucosamine 2-epimerase [Candidatus Vecturithrix sp.]